MTTGRKPLVLTTALTFFKEWSAKSAYVLGVLCADGNVCNTPGKRSVSLELKDAEYVHVLAQTIDTAIPVVDLERRDGRKSAKFYLSRVSIVEDCIEKGLIPAKTHTVQWPSTLPKEFESHFVRGYFDGDGTVAWSWTEKAASKQRRLAFACGSDDFAEALHAVIRSHTSVGGRIWHVVKSCANLNFSQKGEIRAIGEWMYTDSNSLYLPRKYQKWQEVIL
jgi:hypothetical protein